MTNYKPADWPPISAVFAALLGLCLLGAMLGGGLGLVAGWAQGLDVQSVMSGLSEKSSEPERHFARLFMGLNHLFMFCVPGFLTAWFFYRNRTTEWLRLDRNPELLAVGLGIIWLLVSLPLVAFSYKINQWIPLPEWAVSMEDSTADALKSLLKMENGWELAGNLLIIAVLPAIGEEVIFRGIVQQQLMRRLANPHVAIWLAAAIFSTIHFQFEGFLPRMVLGAVLGYLFFWTKNLWVPIAAHLFNNGIQVAGQYFFSEKMEAVDIEKDIDLPVWAVVGSGLLVWFLAKKIIEIHPPDRLKTEE